MKFGTERRKANASFVKIVSLTGILYLKAYNNLHPRVLHLVTNCDQTRRARSHFISFRICEIRAKSAQ